jgi:hypothetical protein
VNGTDNVQDAGSPAAGWHIAHRAPAAQLETIVKLAALGVGMATLAEAPAGRGFALPDGLRLDHSLALALLSLGLTAAFADRIAEREVVAMGLGSVGGRLRGTDFHTRAELPGTGYTSLRAVWPDPWFTSSGMLQSSSWNPCAKSKEAMMRIVQVIAFLGAVAMTVALVYGFYVGDFGAEGSELLSMPWGIVSLVDLYVGFVLFSIWILYRERSLVQALIWVILVMVLGFLTASVYTLIAAFASQGDWRRFWMGARAVQDQATG